MNKRFFCLMLVLCLALSLMACGNVTTRKSYTYKIDNGDKIKVSLVTNDGHDMNSDLPFCIELNGETLSQGTFVQADAFATYADMSQTDPAAEILDQGTKDGNEYIFWTYAGEEFNYIIKIGDSNTAVILANAISQASAEACFDLLSFEED